MSEAHANNQNDAAAASAATEMQELKDKFSKKDKLVALANDDQELFIQLVSSFAEGVVTDWTNDVDASTFTGLGLAKSENGQIRLIPVANMDAAFADPTVRHALYKSYVNRVINTAMDDEAAASQFITVGGCFKQAFNLDAFKFIAKPFVKKLREQGLRSITIPGLRMAFASQKFADITFPRTTQTQWEQILGMAESFAKQNEQDTSIFDHWRAVRNVAEADDSELKLDFTGFTLDDTKDEDEAKKPAAA